MNNLTILAPSVVDLDKNNKFGNCFVVDSKQPISIHKAVEQLSNYFKKEGRFDFTQYTAIENVNNANSHAYIWVEDDWDDTVAIGACEFRFLGDVGQIKNWSLQWVWMHPYFRCKGLLTGAWPSFVEYYGKDFHIEPPLSHEMTCFLNKINHKVEEK